VLAEDSSTWPSTAHGRISEFITYFTLILRILLPILYVLIGLESFDHYYNEYFELMMLLPGIGMNRWGVR